MHIRYLLGKLKPEKFDGRSRTMLFMPFQHGKTHLFTIRHTAYLLERKPWLRLGVTSHTQRFAHKLSRRIRSLVRGRIPLSRERNAAGDWETAAGGSLIALGMGQSFVGEPLDGLIIDDVVKKRKDIDSELFRERMWEWYTEELYTRLRSEAFIMLVNTRWREDDLPGKILSLPNAHEWDVIRLPALAEENDPLGRELNEPLCPEMFSREALLDKQDVLGIMFACSYQSLPGQTKGNMFERVNLIQVPRLPADLSRLRLGRYWDKAGTEKTGSAYSCGVLAARSPLKRTYFADCQRFRKSPKERNEMALSIAQADRELYGHVAQLVEQDPGADGIEAAENMVAMFRQAGFESKAIRAQGSKQERFAALATAIDSGKVCYVSGAWNVAFVNELSSFPLSAFKDQADAASGVYSYLDKPKGEWVDNTKSAPEQSTAKEYASTRRF